MENDEDDTLQVPLQDDGSEYTIDMLEDDQLEIFATVMAKLQESLKEVIIYKNPFRFLEDLCTANIVHPNLKTLIFKSRRKPDILVQTVIQAFQLLPALCKLDLKIIIPNFYNRVIYEQFLSDLEASGKKVDKKEGTDNCFNVSIIDVD